ncbi:uncharacterized protein [Dermacentor albipictus]|uniref:uncharacterized protein n=1 Tax=Dermacentor albipictus TaxID=60249 RepID=UPI0038FD3278
MAVVAAAFTASVWALLWHLYKRALGIWMDQGCFKSHAEGHDEVLFFGVNTDGDRLALNVSRLRNHVAQLWLAVYTQDGRRYSLPAEVTLDRSAGSCFSAAGLRLQCLAPNRRWRVAFNGLLRKHSEATSATSAESEVHVKFGFIWSAVSHTLEQPAELAPAMLAEGCAEGSTLQMLRDVKRLANEMDSYDQAGMMSGEVIVDGERRELCLWGYKIRNQGGCVRLKITQRQRPGESPLVSDIDNECSKTPDFTGGKGSSLAVLDSIAREVKSVNNVCYGSRLPRWTVSMEA